jgi:hypothetical protein
MALATAGIGFSGQAMAAERDMSTFACKDLTSMNENSIAGTVIWFSGFVHGKSGNTMFDGETLQTTITNLRDYCSKSPDATVISAMEEIGKS